jgi:dethiobiotin synthetase
LITSFTISPIEVDEDEPSSVFSYQSVKAFFVTGTDTGVGKTTVSCALCAYCSLHKELDVGVMQPFESGLLSIRHKDLLPWDAISLKETSGSQDDLSLINPYWFEALGAPEAAAELEHVHIDLEHLDRIYDRISDTHEVIFVVGGGGVLAPIRKDFFFSDLIKRWKIPALVVSRLGLGTINHTLLTCRFLQGEGITVAGVILNDTEGKEDAATRTNPAALARYLDVPILGIYPFLGGPASSDRKLLAASVEKHLKIDHLLS